jgi:hypothetical protein
VVLAKRLHDFSVTAWKQDGTVEFAPGGGAMHPDVEKLLGYMPAMDARLAGWN